MHCPTVEYQRAARVGPMIFAEGSSYGMAWRSARIAASCADVSGAGPSPAAELRSAYSFGIIALAARRTPRFRLRAPTRVMAVGRDGEAGRRTTISSPTPMVPGLLTVA